MTHTPLYEHDCTRCVFLGNYTHEGAAIDLYVCDQPVEPTVIARYSSKGSDYASGLYFAADLYMHAPKRPLAEALRRTIRLAATGHALEENDNDQG